MNNTLYYRLIYTLYRNNSAQSVQEYNLLDSFTDANQVVWPAITAEQYSHYTDEQARARASALESSINKCTDYTSPGDVVFENHFEISPTQINVKGGLTERFFTVNSSMPYKVDDLPEWISVLSQTNDGFTLRIAQNRASDSRTATLTLKQQNTPCSTALNVEVNQAGSSTNVIGYYTDDNSDEIAVDFGNENIIVTRITI